MITKTIAIAVTLLLVVGGACCTSRQAGLRAVEGGDLGAGVRKLKEAVEEDPQDAEVQRELGLAYFKLADAALAEAHLDRAVQLDREDRIAYRMLAIARERLGWQLRAAETWERMLQAHPNDRLTKTFLAHLGRYRSCHSGLTREAAQNRVEAQRDRGLLDRTQMPRPILVLPFSGPEVYPEHDRMARSLGRALAADLAGMDLLWVIDPDEAQRGMRERELVWDAQDPAGSTHKMAKAFGAGLVVRGSLLKGFEDELRADVVLLNPDTSTLILDSKTEGTVGQFFALEREVLDKLLSGMGILPNDSERARFGRFATEDASALGMYFDGMGRLLAGDAVPALQELERAVSRDAEFPCAHRALAAIYRMQGRSEKATDALRKGTSRGNPRCAADLDLLERKIDGDTALADLLQSDLEQGRTILRNGVQLLFVGESAPTALALRYGPASSPTVTPDSLPAGFIWGGEAMGLPGAADPSSLGGVKGSGVSAPDPATSGSGGI